MASQKLVQRRQMRYMLESFLRANNAKPGPSMSSACSGVSQRRHARTSACSPQAVSATPGAPVPPVDDSEPVILDAGDGPIPPDSDPCDPAHQDDFNYESQAAGPFHGAQLSNEVGPQEHVQPDLID
jgi:hypothetical protein